MLTTQVSPNGIKINGAHYYEVFKARKQQGKSTRKYCPLFNIFLGEHGEVENHPLLGKRVYNSETTEIAVIDRVCIHWYFGYYLTFTAKMLNNSHVTVIWENYNCFDETILEGIAEDRKLYELID
jgi:hypothetical protein